MRIRHQRTLVFPGRVLPGLAALAVVVVALAVQPQTMPQRSVPLESGDTILATDSVLPSSGSGRSRALAFFALSRVLDGDTIEGVARIWPDLEIRTLVRLRGIDAPELSAGCATERQRAIEARDRLIDILAQGPLHLAEVGRDKYGGRVLARVVLADGADAGERLKAGGHARAYAGGRRKPAC
ncbi:MAG: thermonuclease family protein [Beijerinckiaceae bacterium]